MQCSAYMYILCTCILDNIIPYMYVTIHYLHVHERSVIETRQSKVHVTTPEDNSLFLKRKRRACLRQDSNPQCSAYQADTLPTEPPRQHVHVNSVNKTKAKKSNYAQRQLLKRKRRVLHTRQTLYMYQLSHQGSLL